MVYNLAFTHPALYLCLQDGHTAEAAPPGAGGDGGAPAPGHLLPHQPGLRLRLLLWIRLVRGATLRSGGILMIKGVNKILQLSQYTLRHNFLLIGPHSAARPAA